MPSATTAESRDSIAPSRVKAIASGSTACMAAKSKAGSAGKGSERGMPPKRVPIVSTGSASAAAATEATATPISMPGQDGRQRFSPAMVAMVSKATRIADGLNVPHAAVSALSFGISSPGSLPSSDRPNSSLSWLAKMMTAMPAVKPTVTG